jgi:predicted metal-dependent hydrolase
LTPTCLRWVRSGIYNILAQYVVKRSRLRKKTMTLRLREDGTVIIAVPQEARASDIERFFQEKREWVSRKLKDREECGNRATGLDLLHRGKAPYLGFLYPLETGPSCKGGEQVIFTGRSVVLTTGQMPAQDRVRELMVRWYRARAKEEFAWRIDKYSAQFNLRPKGMRVTSGRYRLGSCSSDNCISLSWRLILAPDAITDYVILHELAHIREKNHSLRFWKYLETLLPDCKTRRRWLKENSHLFAL